MPYFTHVFNVCLFFIFPELIIILNKRKKGLAIHSVSISVTIIRDNRNFPTNPVLQNIMSLTLFVCIGSYNE